MSNFTLTIEYFWPYVWVSILGGLVGIVELISRYRDNPLRAITRFPAIIYIVFNVAASILALYLILVIRPDWLLGEGGDFRAPLRTGFTRSFTALRRREECLRHRPTG